METPVLRQIRARNFRSLEDIDVEFGPFSVLVGPNGSGKSNLLHVLRFIRDTARTDVGPAVGAHGGFRRLLRSDPSAKTFELHIGATVTAHASPLALDEYTLALGQADEASAATVGRLERTESFLHKRNSGPGRRFGFETAGTTAKLFSDDAPPGPATRSDHVDLVDEETSTLAATSRVKNSDLGNGPRDFVEFLTQIRYLDPDVDKARQPNRDEGLLGLLPGTLLAHDASNLSQVLLAMMSNHPDQFGNLLRDLRECLPGLVDLDFASIGGSSSSVVTVLTERGVSSPIHLADASFGTVRMLAILTALHDPTPPSLTIIEEVDHGLHPYALDVLVERMRQASTRTQIIAASHSPTLVNKLRPTEIILCDRDPQSGASIIPAATAEELTTSQARSGLGLGELWYSGAIGGVPDNG